MSKAYDFIKDCGYFYVATINNEFPAVRPFGAIMEVNDKFYIATHDGNEAHKQLRTNGHIQIIANYCKKERYKRMVAYYGYCGRMQ